MKKIFVIISNGEGGIATFQKYFVENALKLKHKVYFIDKNNYTFKYINKDLKSKIKLFKYNPIYQPTQVLTSLKFIKKKESNNRVIFIFNNPLLLILYFFHLVIFFKDKRINLFLHSHILKFNISQILINFFSSLISPFIYRVYFVSKFTKKWWLKYFFLYKFSNYKVFYNSVKIPKIYSKKKLIDTVGFVGRLETEKGIHIFCKIMKNLVKFNIKFEIFGKGSFKNKIFRHKNIKINDWERQENIYKKIGILLVTSPIENCPFSVLEAKSYGIPTLSISNGGIKEIIKNNLDGIILNTMDQSKIKKSLFKIIDNYNSFKRECLIERKKYDEKSSFLKLINEV